MSIRVAVRTGSATVTPLREGIGHRLLKSIFRHDVNHASYKFARLRALNVWRLPRALFGDPALRFRHPHPPQSIQPEAITHAVIDLTTNVAELGNLAQFDKHA